MPQIFYQQSGKRGEADFPKTIVDRSGELRDFDLQSLLEDFDVEAPDRNTFPRGRVQVWGVPGGARHVLKNMSAGDIFLLIGQLSPHGLDYARFFYAGRVVHVLDRENFDLSSHLWGDQGFPLIFFMQGALLNYSWRDFTRDFGFKPNYYVAGQTMRIMPTRVTASVYGNANNFADALGLNDEPVEVVQLPSESAGGFFEGSRTLKEHLYLERSASLVATFKGSLRSFACSVCGFDFQQVYGDLGKGYIEAHHVEPLSGRLEGYSTTNDLAAVCANCHRMLHRQWPALTPEMLRARLRKSP